ncbi:MAG TPA: glucose 1-dehydrogenase [Nocardioidaceae bacterium]|nr:glucose 1-dehydrogenase [Nocardioidaceae bacterium]
MGRLDGKVALVTGSARGQGAAVAQRFVDEGARVVVADVLDDVGKETASALGDSAYFRHLDVSDEHEWASAVEEAAATFGRLDVLVNNAGVLHFAAIADQTVEDFWRVVSVNQLGCFLGMRTVASVMTAQGGGSIVNVSSIEGLAGAPFLIAYNSTKFAIRGMTKTAALELGASGIRVNSVHPGLIDTGMTRAAAGGDGADLDRACRRLPTKRAGRPDDVTGIMTFLASDESVYCTGSEFVVDGGATAGHAFTH